MDAQPAKISGIEAATLAWLLTLASLDVPFKYFGWAGVAGYAVIVFAAVFALHQLLPRIGTVSNDKLSFWFAIVFFAAMIVGVMVVYPMATSGAFGGGSDADDALRLAATELINGRYPFYPRTYLGNPIAPMPGAVILAVPFVLVGLIQLQNVVWLAAFYAVIRKQLSNGLLTLTVFVAAIILSPAVWQNLATATDRVSNTIYILIAMWLMMRYIPDDGAPAWKKIASAVFLGIGLSSRSNFLFLLPILFSALAQSGGWKTALRYLAITGLAAAAMTVPFWLYDPAGFTPFTTQGQKILELEGVLPYARYLVPLLGLSFGIVFACRKLSANSWRFYWYCAVVQINMIVVISALSTMKLGYADLYFGHVSYGVFALVFAVMAAAIRLDGSLREAA